MRIAFNFASFQDAATIEGLNERGELRHILKPFKVGIMAFSALLFSAWGAIFFLVADDKLRFDEKGDTISPGSVEGSN